MSNDSISFDQDNFIQFSQNLIKTQFTLSEQLLINYIYSYQRNGDECFITDEALAFCLRMGYSTVRELLEGLRKRGVVISVRERRINKWGKYSNTRYLSIDVDVLNAIVEKEVREYEAEYLEKKSKKVKKQQTPGADQEPVMVKREQFNKQTPEDAFLDSMYLC